MTAAPPRAEPLDEPAAPLAGPAVDEMLCLALHRATRAMDGVYRRLLAPTGLTYPQYLVLVLLDQEGASTVGGLGARLGLESSTLSPLLGRLAERGLVTRTRGTGDERRVVVELTDDGRALRASAAGVPDRVCAATGLTAEQMTSAVEELRRLVAVLETS